MGIYDRDYMREDDPADWWKPGQSIKRWLLIGILAVSLLTSVLYFARSAGFGRTKQSAARINDGFTDQYGVWGGSHTRRFDILPLEKELDGLKPLSWRTSLSPASFTNALLQHHSEQACT